LIVGFPFVNPTYGLEGRGNPEVVAPFFDELEIDIGRGAVIEFAVIP